MRADSPTWHRQALGTKEYAIMETKVCTSCKTEKPVSDFHRFGSGGARVGKWCEDVLHEEGRRQTGVAAEASPIVEAL